MVMSLSEVVALKKEIDERYQIKLHFHDGCGGQYFTLEHTTADIQKYIADYLLKKNLCVSFSTDGRHFSIKEIARC